MIALIAIINGNVTINHIQSEFVIIIIFSFVKLMTTIFDVKQLFSNCCHAFIVHGDENMYCANCRSIIHTYQNDDEILLNVEYNVLDNSESKKIASDLIQNQSRHATRLAHDASLAIIYIECPKCHNNRCRLSEDDNKEKFYICTKCRNVFRQN
jgi:DNA-directed RNA polymerase subunit M/transcription elongation factor TFIIS